MFRFPFCPEYRKRSANLTVEWRRRISKSACSIAVITLALLTNACSPFTTESTLPRAVALSNAPSPQITPTYDGSGTVVEPSIVFFSSGWNGFRYWLVVSPYPNSDGTKENPSILVSNDGTSWEVPPGLTNPIDLPTAGHLADSELFYDEASGQLCVYYIWEDYRGFSHILRKVSSDGVHWSQRQDLFKVPDYDVTAPTVDKNDDTYYMWSINAGKRGCDSTNTTIEYRTSTDGIVWSEPQLVNILQPGYVIWHIEVRYVPLKHEYWMLSAAYPEGDTCGYTVLFFNNSSDGINWKSYAKPALGLGLGWDNGQIYRSTFLFDSRQDMLEVWYGARSSSGEWHMGFTAGVYADFLRWLQD
jgi:hypothetical protein